MKKVCLWLALAGWFLVPQCLAISLDDIQLWTGSGTNRAALVIEWNAPVVINNGNTVPPPVANKTLVWGYRFNGAATGTQMFNAIVAANPSLYAVEYIDPTYGTEIDAIGFNLNGAGIAGVTDGTITDTAGAFNNGILMDANLNVDGAYSLNSGDLFWSGFVGPYWQLWNELGDAGGFPSSPNVGTNQFMDPDTYTQGQWASAYLGLDDLPLTNGSWIGFSISADGYDSDTNDPDQTALNNIFFDNEQAPLSPDGTYVAYVANPNDFAAQVISTNNLDPSSPYNNPAAMLGAPTQRYYSPPVTNEITKVVEPEYNTLPDKVTPCICEIKTGGYITVKMASPIYHNPGNPYGFDFIVFGNSLYTANGGPAINNQADMGLVTIGAGTYGHTTIVSVSPDGSNWYTYPYVPALLPGDAYQWDYANHVWNNELAFADKPVNPSLYLPAKAGVTNVIAQYVGANGGTPYSLQGSGFSSIQYVRIWAGKTTNDTVATDYTVIDAIGAVHPVPVGDALSITPGNVAAGLTNLVFQNPANLNQTLISLNFDSVSTNARVSTVSLREFSAFAPVAGNVSSAYQLQSRPLAGAASVALQADIGLAAGAGYTGDGSDLRVYEWNSTNWVSQAFTYNPANNQVLVPGVTNFTAFAISQIVPPHLSVAGVTNGFSLQFAPVANCAHVLERSTDLVNWTSLSTNTFAGPLPVTWQDTNAPAGNAFYRVLVNVP